MRLILPTVLLLAGLVSAPSTAAASPADDAVRLRDAHGVHVEKATREGRLVRVVVSSEALQRPVDVNVLLPRGYDDTRHRWPSYYLFHGTSGDADDWLEAGGVRTATRDRDLITVMPEAGYDGNGGSWFTDWLDQDTELGAARWETFHNEQLVPWVDANFRTVRDRAGRAIAGLSQGGFGSFTYAARHPDLYGAAASFSGAPDIARHPVAKSGATGVVSATMTGLNQVQPFAPFGDPAINDIVWQGHNPATLVRNMRHTDLRLWTGNGQPGPYDDPATPNPASNTIEWFTYRSTLFFAEAATADGVPYVLTDYGAGTHTFDYWARDLRQWLPKLERFFEQERRAPRTIEYRSIDKLWTQWGWRVRTDRAPRFAWSGLTRANRGGFTLEGGPATVTTPGAYRPGRRYELGYEAGTGPAVVRANEKGRLRIAVQQEGLGLRPVRVTVTPKARP